MPSTSAKQAKFMRAVAHSPKFAKKAGVPQSVGKDFEMADKKTKKFGDGGAATKPKPKPKPTPRPAPGGNDPYERMPPEYKPEKPKLGPSGQRGYKKGGSVMKKAGKGAAKARKFDVGGVAGGSSVPPPVNRGLTDQQQRQARFDAFADRAKEYQMRAARTPQGKRYSSPQTAQQTAAQRGLSAGLTGTAQSGPMNQQQMAQQYAAARNSAGQLSQVAKPSSMTPQQTPQSDSGYSAYRQQATQQLGGTRAASNATQAVSTAGKGLMGMKKGGKATKKGGSAMKSSDKAGRALMKKSADTMGRAMKMNKGGKCYAKGGSVSARADGIAKKGKTKGKVL